MMIHEIKLHPDRYSDIIHGTKQIEISKNDNTFQEGDWLNLKEWNGNYTGRSCLRHIEYLKQIAESKAIIGLSKIP